MFSSSIYAKELPASPAVTAFVESKAAVNAGTAKVVHSYLRTFQQFVFEMNGQTVDQLVLELQKDQANNHASGRVYDLRARFVKWQVAANEKTSRPISAKVIRYKTKCVKDFLEYNDILIIPSQFRVKVSLPRSVQRAKEPLDKDFVRKILLAAETIKHRAYFHFLAVTGCRAQEALSVTLDDLDLDSNPPRVFIRGEYTKTKRDRIVFITHELKNTLQQWIDYKYRPRQVQLAVTESDRKTGHGTTPWVENYIPPKKECERVFQVIHHDGIAPSLKHMYF